MSTDILLTLLNAVSGVVLALIGIEMVNNPPDKGWKKWTYRALFSLFGTAVIVTTVIQAVRTENAQTEARREAFEAKEQAHADQLASQNKLGYMQGTLDAIANYVTHYVAHPPTSQSVKFDPSWALAILKMAQSAAAPATPQALAPSSGAPRRYFDPIISSAPTMFHDGQITGKDFGEAPGDVYLHPYVKPSGRHGIYENNSENLLGGLNNSNYVILDKNIIQKWSDTSIQLKFPSGYWQTLMLAIISTAKDRKIDPPSQSDIDVCYQVKRPDWEKSACFYPQ